MMAAANLSDLILRGCSAIPKQEFGSFFRERQGRIISACAMFTACHWYRPAEAFRLRHEPHTMYDELDKFLVEHHGVGLWNEVAHPVTGDAVYVGTLVETLNDQARWSRERIARWLKERGQ